MSTAAECWHNILQPHTSDHLSAAVTSAEDFFRDACENYSCLQAGETIPLWVGKQIDVTIQGLEPAGTEPLCIRNCEIELELLPPLDMPLPAPPVLTAPSAVEPEPQPQTKFPGAGHTLGGAGVAPTASTRELALAAALKRFATGAATNDLKMNS